MTDATGYLAILVVAGLTYGLRLGSLVLGQHLPARGRIAEALERLPGIVLVALVAPAVLALEWPGLAGAAAAASAWRASGGNLLTAMCAGSAAVALVRML